MDIHDRTSSKKDTASANIRPRLSFILRSGTKWRQAFLFKVHGSMPCAATSCKFVSNSLALVDFAIGLVDSDHHLPDRQVKLFWQLKLKNYCKAYFF